MSGGHWNYMGGHLDDLSKKSSEVWRFLSVVEHELDWGICSDTCEGCADARLPVAMKAFFDSACADATVAIALMNDRSQNKCIRCGEEK